MKKILYAAPLALALALAGCGETTVEDVSSDKKTEAKADAEKKDKVYKVGDTVKVNDVEITITKAEFTKAAAYSEPVNDKILTLDVSINNASDSQTYVSDTDFGLSVGDEQAEDYFGYDELALSADLNKGKKASGKLYYDVKDSDTYELIYTPSFSFDDTEVKWTIKVK